MKKSFFYKKKFLLRLFSTNRVKEKKHITLQKKCMQLSFFCNLRNTGFDKKSSFHTVSDWGGRGDGQTDKKWWHLDQDPSSWEAVQIYKIYLGKYTYWVYLQYSTKYKCICLKLMTLFAKKMTVFAPPKNLIHNNISYYIILFLYILFQSLTVICLALVNKPGVAGAVLQTPTSFNL